MNLYNLHSKPESLDFYDTISETNPDFFWKKYRNNREELKKREKYIAKSPNNAFYYARDVLKGPFPAGEEVIAKNIDFAYYYVRDILKGPFPAGEEAISKDADSAFQYAKHALKKDFYFNSKLIAKYEP